MFLTFYKTKMEDLANGFTTHFQSWFSRHESPIENGTFQMPLYFDSGAHRSSREEISGRLKNLDVQKYWYWSKVFDSVCHNLPSNNFPVVILIDVY